MKHFTSVQDVPDLSALMNQAFAYKQAPLKDYTLGQGKRIGLLFMNASLRTRLSTQIAATNLGLQCIVFNAGADGWKLELEDGVVMNGTSVEHIKDAAPVLGQYFDIIAVRTFPDLKSREVDGAEALLQGLIKYAAVPVVSLESATLHPLQGFTDLLTIAETWKQQERPKVVMTWAPHVKPLPHCVPHSFAEWMIAWGKAELVITHPEGYELDPKYTGNARIDYDQQRALSGADYVYVKNWSAWNDYGQLPPAISHRPLSLRDLALTRNASVMHCLPVRRNVELSDEVLDSAHSLVAQQAGNRIWAAQAVLAEILKNSSRCIH